MYWRVTTQDGTQYYFGINYRYAGDTAQTLSTQYQPVYLAAAGAPCPAGKNWCQLGYRWNLDYDVDQSNNSMTYDYAQMIGRVGANNNTNNQPYVMSDTLDHIDYGERAGSEAATTAPTRVTFTRDNRCVSPCAQGVADYYDTPWDLFCSSTTSCPSTLTPVYFTRYRLIGVTTQVWNGTAYRNVDYWHLTYTWPATDLKPNLWLSTITHTGYAADGTTALAEPAVTLSGTAMANRADNAAAPSLKHYRLTQMLNGTGGETDVAYSSPPCSVADTVTLTGNADTNPWLCFPQYFQPAGSTTSEWGWFQKYTVTSVTVKDLTGGSPDEVYSYAYSTAGSSEPTIPAGTPAALAKPALWHHDYNDSTPPSAGSWSQFSGFSTVTVTHGAAGGPQTVTKSLYYRGMNGDNYVGGALRKVTLTDSQGSGITDSEALQGRLLEQTQMDGAAIASSAINTYASTQTAHRVLSASSSGPDWYAYLVTTTKAQTRTWIAATTSWRWTETDTTYNSYGLPTLVKDLGDPAVPAQARCTTTSYVTADTVNWMIDFPAQRTTTDCAATPAYLTGQQWFYDGSTTNAATPTIGLVTATTALASASGATLTWAPASKTGYDANGRVTDSWDALSRHTGTAYTPATGGPVTAITTTNPMNWASTATIEPGHGSVTLVSDVNGKTTNAAYDPLGRLTQVWLHNRLISATPDRQYTYTLSSTATPGNSVETQTLGPTGAQVASYTIYDGQLRPRQVQAPVAVATGGRWITDTAYDSRGMTAKTSAFYNNASGPAGSLATFTDATVPTQDQYTYDNLGRKTTDAFYSLGAQQWQTTWAYDGDRTGVIPPAGGTTQQQIFNARGDMTELRQFTAASLTGTYQSTSYTYDQLRHLTKVTDSQNNTWTWQYDTRGRQISASTPDTGNTQSSYDDAGQLTSSTDARPITLAYAYDNLGRKTGAYLGSLTGTQLTGWAYDPAGYLGQLASATQYTGGNAYTTTVTGYDDAYRPQGTSVTLPAAEGAALTGTWTTTTSYNPDGSVASIGYPAAGGLPAETVSNTYDANGYLLTAIGADTYLSAASYQPWGDVYQRMLGTGTSRVQVTTDQWPDTHRTKTISVGTEHPGTPGTFDEQLTQQYNWTPAGTLSSVDSQHTGTTTDSQCYTYDNLQRLVTAFTTTPALGGCAATPSATTAGGPDAYWQTYAYDPTGNRTSLTSHGLAGAADTTSTYKPATTAPHELASVGTTGPAGITSNSYTYLPAGQMSNMTINGLSADFTYTEQNQVATATTHATAGNQVTNYLYDATGTEILRGTPADKTLYLGGTDITTDSAGNAITGATRYYTAAGATIASRTSTSGLTWLASDQQGTAQIAITQTTLAVSIRKQDPFGNPRGTVPAWPNPRGFVGGTPQPTGLIHLGARMYDPATGRFTSADPVLTAANPQQLNGYAYAGNNPTTTSDPTGLYCDGCASTNPGGAWGATAALAAPPRAATARPAIRFPGQSRTTDPVGRVFLPQCSGHPPQVPPPQAGDARRAVSPGAKSGAIFSAIRGLAAISRPI